jgi:peptidoglycan/LPS O-acetylase OafA/YrhL
LLTIARVGFGVLTTLLLAYLSFGYTHRGQGYSHPDWNFTWRMMFVDLFSACLIVMALESGSITFHLFNLRPLRWVGRISYGAYVYHDILHGQYIWLIVHYHVHHVEAATAALGLACTLLLSWASFRWFETPFIQLKQRWSRPAQTHRYGANA